ncbi:hypothetical protein M8J76_007887 [Diaphorina citri]|nr:hypothetical protein M8J75_012827 [Diaphorina citri]KAI5745060.1 hypothetical protein M8J76_007887 [Diaphorina citri]
MKDIFHTAFALFTGTTIGQNFCGLKVTRPALLLSPGPETSLRATTKGPAEHQRSSHFGGSEDLSPVTSTSPRSRDLARILAAPRLSRPSLLLPPVPRPS